MALTSPTDPQATEATEVADSSFEIEEGHFGSHLPRPNWEVVCAVGGALFLLVGSYLPWLTITQRSFDQGPNGQGAPTITTIQLGGWAFVSGTTQNAQSGSLGGAGLIALAALPALAGLVALGMNILWYRRRANTLSCGVAVSALVAGFGLLFAETAALLMAIIVFAIVGSSSVSTQVGFAFPLMYLGYFGLIAATFAMCVGYRRGGAHT